jgi:hypothetical protein
MLREIGGRPVGSDHPVFVIAEIGLNHSGSLDRARREAQTAVDRALRQERSALPTKEWLDFGGDTASAAQIDAAVDSASAGLSAAVRKRSTTLRTREPVNP